jgi:phenylacetate-CoA ligase
MMFWLRQCRAQGISRLLQGQREFYAQDWSVEAIRDWQLARFNTQWQDICQSVPYFRYLQQQQSLPQQFASWPEFLEHVPVMERRTIQQHGMALTRGCGPAPGWRTTGGSTAEPLRVPVWASETALASQDMWYGRSWYGVTPADRLFLIWGHSHMLGRGVRGWANGMVRRLKDACLGYYRWSAYNLREQQLKKAADTLLTFRPAYVMAYAAALDRFARVNRHRQPALQQLGLKVAIATGEAFPMAESAEMIAEVLGCPVAMEYGAVETGPIAYQQGHGEYAVFWQHYFVEARASTQQPGASEILVTSLFRRCLPLVRYRLGDLVVPPDGQTHGLQFLTTVRGRRHDLVQLYDGSVVHAEALTHAIKETAAITGYQVRQAESGPIALRYTAAQALPDHELTAIRQRLRRIHAALAEIPLERVDTLAQTRAGKTPCIVRAPHSVLPPR